MKRSIYAALAVGTILAACAALQRLQSRCRPGPGDAAATASSPGRPWAARLDRPGLHNLHRVSDDLYRGAQPAAEGMRQLKAMGVRTVVNLRARHSDAGPLGGTGLDYEHLPVDLQRLDRALIVRFLRIVTDERRTPVFVHCQVGAHRTGVMCAIYRVAVQGWSTDEAIREMTDGGFGFRGGRKVVACIEQLDVQAIRRRAGLEP